jgi:hypothetical protein
MDIVVLLGWKEASGVEGHRMESIVVFLLDDDI